MFQRPGRVSCGQTGGGVERRNSSSSRASFPCSVGPSWKARVTVRPAIAADAVRRKQFVVGLLFAPERKRERTHQSLLQRLHALGQFPPQPPPRVARGSVQMR